ncbi:MucR family transcriptional regulator [Inquilinus sp. Marseille-Q2685]|uniref:MucR family transcriptional regulator n=1 Tax=Inquilinus sp. Marseille-Q2685 TaxID=2866581 RepID=UPI001CE3DA0A|nr:MucR family transcriptional regulator [Inquilinus sp. Marseille-Q2685]
MDMDLRRSLSHHRDFAAQIARAFRSRQPAAAPEDPTLIRKILAAFDDLSEPPRARARKIPHAAEPQRMPPVPLPETIGLGFLICLEDGRVCRDLGRHLDTAHGLSPDQYRQRWGLPAAYPMVPPPSHEERQAWRRRLASPPDGAGRDPVPLRLQEESRRIGAGRARRQHRRGAPAGLRLDWVKPGVVSGRRSEGPRPDGFRR